MEVEWIASTEALAAVIAAVGDGPLAMDLEADSFHHFREKVCLVQLAFAGARRAGGPAGRRVARAAAPAPGGEARAQGPARGGLRPPPPGARPRPRPWRASSTRCSPRASRASARSAWRRCSTSTWASRWTSRTSGRTGPGARSRRPWPTTPWPTRATSRPAGGAAGGGPRDAGENGLGGRGVPPSGGRPLVGGSRSGALEAHQGRLRTRPARPCRAAPGGGRARGDGARGGPAAVPRAAGRDRGGAGAAAARRAPGAPGGPGIPRPFLSQDRARALLGAIAHALALPEDALPEVRRGERVRVSPAFEQGVQRLREARDRVAAALDLDPSLVAPRGTLEAVAARELAGEPAESVPELRAWQAEVLLPAWRRP